MASNGWRRLDGTRPVGVRERCRTGVDREGRPAAGVLEVLLSSYESSTYQTSMPFWNGKNSTQFGVV